nr:hypothetical protein Itr_chr10CG14120 [Ipomoea trifida]
MNLHPLPTLSLSLVSFVQWPPTTMEVYGKRRAVSPLRKWRWKVRIQRLRPPSLDHLRGNNSRRLWPATPNSGELRAESTPHGSPYGGESPVRSPSC